MTTIMLGLLLAVFFQLGTGAETYELVEVKFPSPLYLSNTTLFNATFQGSDPFPTSVVFELYIPGATTSFQGSGWPTVHFTATIGSVEEGRHNYTFRIGSWSSPNRTVDVVDYFHLQFVNWEGHVENRLHDAALRSLDLQVAREQWDLARSYASQDRWQDAYLAALETNRLIDEAYLTAQHGLDTFLWYTGGSVLGIVSVLTGGMFWKAHRNRRLSRAR